MLVALLAATPGAAGAVHDLRNTHHGYDYKLGDAGEISTSRYLERIDKSVTHPGRTGRTLAVHEETGRCASSATRARAALTLFNKSVALGQQGKIEEAIAVYEEIDRRFGQDAALDMRELVAMALFNKGLHLAQLGKSGQAIAIYDEVDRRFSQSGLPGIRQSVAVALINKGMLLVQQGQNGEALAVYEEIDRRFGRDDSPGGGEQVAKALGNKGVLLGQQDKSGEALAVYEEIDRRFGRDVLPSVRDQVAKALINKSTILKQRGKTEEEFAVYEEIDRRFGQDASPGMRRWVTAALFNKGLTLRKQGKTREAIAVFEEIERRFGQDASPGVFGLVAEVLVYKASTLYEFHDDAAGALAILNQVLARCSNSPEPALQEACSDALQDSVEPLLVLGKAREAAQRIRQVQGKLAAADGKNAIMAFLLWLAEAQMPAKTVREVIRALPPDAQFGWTFDGIRPFTLALPAPRQAQAQCFLAFFEQHHDVGKLDACLGATIPFHP
jgi:tetratricopeptide (TPR) repeat protein